MNRQEQEEFLRSLIAAMQFMELRGTSDNTRCILAGAIREDCERELARLESK
jgi:hypothetical protein